MDKLLDLILDNTARQRYALAMLFKNQPRRLFSRTEIMIQMGNPPYSEILSACSIAGKDNPLVNENNSTIAPTILRDRLKELVDKGVIVYSGKDGREVLYKLNNQFNGEIFDAININKYDLDSLTKIVKSLAKFKDFPFWELLKSIEVKLLAESDDENNPEEDFAIIDIETPLVRELELIENIKGLYDVICERRYISLQYQGHFYSNREPEIFTARDFMPYILKESRGQWYVVGKCPEDIDFRTVPLNRIIGEPEYDNEREFVREHFKPEEYWDGCLGITRYGTPITISFRVKNGNVYNNIDYIRTIPIIKGHQEVKQEGEWMKVTLKNVYMGPELVRVIRSFGTANVCNVTPAWLEEDLWEAGIRKTINLSILFPNPQDIDPWKMNAEKQLKIVPNGENADAAVSVNKSLNKKDWYQVTLNNVLINSVLYFFIEKYVLSVGDNRIVIKDRSFLK